MDSADTREVLALSPLLGDISLVEVYIYIWLVD